MEKKWNSFQISKLNNVETFNEKEKHFYYFQCLYIFFFTCTIDACHWLETCVLHVLLGIALLVASNELLLPQTLRVRVRVREWISSNGAKTSLASYYSIACHHIIYFVLSLSLSVSISLSRFYFSLSLTFHFFQQ